MKRAHKLTIVFFSVATLAVSALALSGCPWLNLLRTANILVLLTADDEYGGKQYLADTFKLGPVPLEDIESLTVVVTKVTLKRDDDADDDDEEQEDEDDFDKDDDGAPERVTVFEGATPVDLANLVGLSEILTAAEIPSGLYRRIELKIEDPELVLASDPETMITDVHLTANSRLFVKGFFLLPANQQSLILLDLNGLHLAELGNGGFTLTPQLRADVTVENAAVQTSGTITALDTDADTIVVSFDTTDITAVYTGAAIFLPGDAGDSPTGTEADLLVGAGVQVTGLLNVNGTLAAETIVILPPPAP